MRHRRWALVFGILAACQSAPPLSVWSWPDDARGAQIEVSLDGMPARTALAFLAAPQADPALRAAAIQAAVAAAILPAVGVNEAGYGAWLDEARAPQPSGRLAGAARRASDLLASVEAVEGDRRGIEAGVRRRALWLLADLPERPVHYRVVLALGIEAASETMPLPAESGGGILFDPAKSFTELEGHSSSALADLVVRRVAPDFFELLRLGQGVRAPLPPSASRNATIVERLQIEGPLAYLSFSEDFFPLSRWLATPLGAAWERFDEAVRNPPRDGDFDLLLAPGAAPFWRRDLALAGALMVDAVATELGAEAVRRALVGGPSALIAAYRLARQHNPQLPPLPPDLLS